MPVPEFYLAENDKLRDNVRMLNQANMQLAHALRISLEESARLEKENLAMKEALEELKSKLALATAPQVSQVVVVAAEKPQEAAPVFNASAHQKSGLFLYQKGANTH